MGEALQPTDGGLTDADLGKVKPAWPGEARVEPADGTEKPPWPRVEQVVATIALPGLPAGHTAWVDAHDPYIQGLLASRYLVPRG